MSEAVSPQTPLQPLDILMVEDNPADAELCARELKKAGFNARLEVVQTEKDFATRLQSKRYHLVLGDYTLPDWSGEEALELVKRSAWELPFILVTGTMREEQAARCLDRGASDYVLKDRLVRITLAVRLALEKKALRDEHKQLREQCRVLEERLQRLNELSSDALFVVEGRKIVSANPAAAKLLGAEGPEQLIGQPVAPFVEPVSLPLFEERLGELASSSKTISFTAKLLRRDGQSHEMLLTGAPVLVRNEPAVELMVRDVGELKRVEEAIRSLAAFAELNPNPVLEFSREGKITYFNDAASEMAKSLGRDHPAALLPPDTASIVQACLTTGQKKLRLETTLGGRTFSWSFYPIKRNNVVHCYVGDITERQHLEAQLRHSQKLESVGRLAAGIAHDFNNVLTVIQGNTSVLRSDAGLSPHQSEHLQQIARGAERGTKLTSQLLAFSRRTALQPRQLDLNEIITHLSSLLHRTLGEDITYQFSYASELPPVCADAASIEQVILNIAVNARDAMPKGGQLFISTSLADIDASYVERHPAEARAGRFVCLTIADTGCGMDNVTLSRIFEPFFTTKEFGKGTGLGLATVYGIIKQHHGWIDVQSRVGQGSTFKVFLPPYEKAADRRPEKASDSIVPRGTETILVVEDEPPVRWIVKDVLEKYGYAVLEAGSGVEALALWHQHHGKIALLLTDMVMPVGLSGQELAEKFIAQKPNLKVIYISGYSSQVAGKGISGLAGLNFLQKPFDGAKLALAVRQCLDT